MMRIHRTGPRVDAVDGVAGRELRHSCCEARHARFEGGHPVELSDLSAIDHKALTFNNLISYCHDQTLVAKDFQAPSTWRLFLRDPQRGSLGICRTLHVVLGHVGPWETRPKWSRWRLERNICWSSEFFRHLFSMLYSASLWMNIVHWYIDIQCYTLSELATETNLHFYDTELSFKTGQKGVVDLSVWWSEIFWNIYLGALKQWSVNSMWILNQCARTV